MEEIKKIASDLGNRIKGTYGATFVLVWLVLNWRFIYILLSFDKSYTLPHKIEVLNNYVEKNSYCYMLWYPIAYTLISIIIYYVLNYITFTITTFFNLTVKPKIQEILDKKKLTIISRDLYDKLKVQFDEISEKYNKESQNFIDNNKKLKDIKIDMKNQIELLNKTQNELDQKSTLFDQELSSKETEYLIQKEKLINENKILEKERGFYITKPTRIFPGNWIKFFKELDGNIKGKEQFNVTDKYFRINNTETFEFTEFKKNGNVIEFWKFSFNSNRTLHNTLIKINDQHYIGVESDTQKYYSVEYIDMNKYEDQNQNKKLNT
jgi:hypothetical protein